MPLHPDDLNKAWVCHKCRRLFVFRDDRKRHAQISGHHTFAVFDLNTGKLVKNSEMVRVDRDALAG